MTQQRLRRISGDRFDSLDRDVIEYVVTCVHHCTRFYIADNASNTATDIIDRARRFRDATDAEMLAVTECNNPAWQSANGFRWTVGRYFPTTGRLLVGDDVCEVRS